MQLRRALRFSTFLLSVFFLVASVSTVAAQESGYEQQRKLAFELWEQNRMTEAVPILESLAKAKPADLVVQERLGFALFVAAESITDAEQKKAQRKRAREIMLHAREMGDNSNLINTVLAGMSPDGSDVPYSERKDVHAAVQEGEAAFSKGDFDAAIAAYAKALALDPNNYPAALYTGDIYFRKKQWDTAGEWFARAIRANADGEQAYRYWGDALLQAGKVDEARAKYIGAIIAQPYQRSAWVGLVQLAQRSGKQLTAPRIDTPAITTTASGAMTVQIDPKNFNAETGTNLWIGYPGIRSLWQKERFRQQYPKEENYRHSLAEEYDALHTVAMVVRNAVKDGKIKSLDPQLATLLKLDDAGLLESYILLSRPDQGIAQDYMAYRSTHRDKLRQYIEEFVVAK